MPFAAAGAADWLAAWDAGQPVQFVNAPNRNFGKTVTEQAAASAEVLRVLLSLDPDPSFWVVKELWRASTDDIRQDLRQTFRQWDLQAVAWCVDCGMTLYADGPAEWFAAQADNVVLVSAV